MIDMNLQPGMFIRTRGYQEYGVCIIVDRLAQHLKLFSEAGTYEKVAIHGDIFAIENEDFRSPNGHDRLFREYEAYVRRKKSEDYNRWMTLGEQQKNSDTARGVDAFTKALAIEPRSVEALSCRAHSLMTNQKYVEAIADWTEIRARGDESSVTFQRLAQCFVGLMRWQEAIAQGEQALALNPQSAQILRLLADAHRGQAGAYDDRAMDIQSSGGRFYFIPKNEQGELFGPIEDDGR